MLHVVENVLDALSALATPYRQTEFPFLFAVLTSHYLWTLIGVQLSCWWLMVEISYCDESVPCLWLLSSGLCGLWASLLS